MKRGETFPFSLEGEKKISTTVCACLNQAGSGCWLQFLGAQIVTKVVSRTEQVPLARRCVGTKPWRVGLGGADIHAPGEWALASGGQYIGEWDAT